MRSLISSIVLTAALAAPAFAKNAPPAGVWNGVLLRDGVESPIMIRLSEKDQLWKGRIGIAGVSSPAQRISVSGNTVHFELSDQAVFEATFSGDSMNGKLSGGDAAGTFAMTRDATRDASESEWDDPIGSSGP
jgi:hypothetical protein